MNEPYAYIEMEAEEEAFESAYLHYQEIMQLVQNGVGLNPKEWNDALDKYRLGQGISEPEHAKMSGTQKWVIHEIDKSDTRIKGRESKVVVDGKELEIDE